MLHKLNEFCEIRINLASHKIIQGGPNAGRGLVTPAVESCQGKSYFYVYIR